MTSSTSLKGTATSLSVTATTPSLPAPIVIGVAHSNLLTVGAGMEFATLGDALRAAVNGDTIAVKAGTYTNDFGTVSAQVTIVAVGGLVHEVATEPPPDDKGILTVNANLTIEGFTFTGGSDGSPDGNVAGIRLQSGNLNLSYCAFTSMQEGLLADPNPNGSVTIDHSFFLDNGTGDGLTHNLYVGAVKSLTVTNSLFEGAVVGHEIKSRAAYTTIENNTIIDGPTGTGSYDIDIPNGGVAVVESNIIEKGPDASNDYAIHYGGETQYSYAQNSLQVTGNTIINDLPESVPSYAVYNESAVNGLDVTAEITGNDLYNYAAGYVALGQANAEGNTRLSSEPAYSTQSPLALLPSISLANGPQMLDLSTGNHTVTGGTGLLIVCDTAGSNTISGGSGGMQISANAGWDQIATEAGAADTINTPGRSSVVDSHGTDVINASGAYELIEATGHATISGSGFSTYDLDGAGETLTTDWSGLLNIGAAGNATVHDTAGDLTLTVAAGGKLTITDTANAKNVGTAMATVSGAMTGTIANAGTISLVTGGTGALIQAGSGPVVVSGGAGNDTLMAGSGADNFTLGSGADSIVFGSGDASVKGGSGADTYVFTSGADGNDTICGFKPGTDSLVFEKFAHSPTGSIVNGSTLLNLSDGTKIDLVGVSLPGYAQASSQVATSVGTVSAVSTGPAAGTQAPASACVTLTTGGHDLQGGSSCLSVVDAAGGNTIAGGQGGVSVMAATYDAISTAAGSTDSVVLGCYDTLTGAGADQVTVTGYRNTITESGAATLALLGTVNTVQGGAGLLHVTDVVGGSAMTGGAGGLVATLAGTFDQVTTQHGANDTVSLGGYGTLLSQGNDKVTISGMDDSVTVTGAASISAGAGYSSYVLDGTEQLTSAGSFVATVGGAANATIASNGSDGGVTKLAGGSVVLTQALASGPDSVSVSGGQATCGGAGGTYAGVAVTVSGGGMVTAGTGPVTVTGANVAGAAADTVYGGSGSLQASAGAQGLNLHAGSGNVTLNGGTGNDEFTGGAGLALLTLGAGADTITFGNGTTTVEGGTTDRFVIPVGCTGTAVIMNWSSQDSLVGPAIVSDKVTGGSIYLGFQGGAQIELVGVSHFP